MINLAPRYDGIYWCGKNLVDRTSLCSIENDSIPIPGEHELIARERGRVVLTSSFSTVGRGLSGTVSSRFSRDPRL